MPAGTNLFFLLKKVRLVNKTSSNATASFWLGATGANAAGTEVLGNTVTVPALSYIDIPLAGLRLDVADFLVGGASANTAITFMAEGEIGVA